MLANSEMRWICGVLVTANKKIRRFVQNHESRLHNNVQHPDNLL